MGMAPWPTATKDFSPLESAKRDCRFFGGLEGEEDTMNLRARMLDVVLGLFNGLDYDDST
jgi:hypothetical protein